MPYLARTFLIFTLALSFSLHAETDAAQKREEEIQQAQARRAFISKCNKGLVALAVGAAFVGGGYVALETVNNQWLPEPYRSKTNDKLDQLIKQNIIGGNSKFAIQMLKTFKGRKSQWETFMNLAIQWNRHEIVDSLFSLGYDVKGNLSAFLIASENNDKQMILKLLDHGADVRQFNDEIFYRLFANTSKPADADLFEQLIKRGGKLDTHNHLGGRDILSIIGEHDQKFGTSLLPLAVKNLSEDSLSPEGLRRLAGSDYSLNLIPMLKDHVDWEAAKSDPLLAKALLTSMLFRAGLDIFRVKNNTLFDSEKAETGTVLDSIPGSQKDIALALAELEADQKAIAAFKKLGANPEAASKLKGRVKEAFDELIRKEGYYKHPRMSHDAEVVTKRSPKNPLYQLIGD